MNSAEEKSRPKLLTLLCIGSFVSGSLWSIMLLSLIIFSLKGRIPEGLFPGLAIGYIQAGYLFTVALILLTILCLAGVYLMWQLNRTGFYLYATGKAAIYYLPVIVIGNSHLTFIGLSITSAVIIMYGAQFISLRKNN